MRKPNLTDVAARLAWARGISGLSAWALSKKAKLSCAHVGLIENGKRTHIHEATAKSLAEQLGVSWVWLLTGEGDEPSEEQIRAANPPDILEAKVG